jgi:pimeloyl-ACP methyl ester carboxylesterase
MSWGEGPESPTRAPVRHVLLVHGAWHGAWCWDRVLEPLRQKGLHAEAIDLPGHGDSRDPLGDLHGDADAVIARLDAIGEPTLLVGHSYGGMVITDAGASEWAAALVYVCAFLPTAGLCLFDAGLQDPPSGEQPAALVPCTRFTEDGTAMFLDGDGVVDALYADCKPEAQHRALARLDHQPTVSFRQTPRFLAWQWKPTTYIVCTEDRTIPSWLQRRMAANAGRVVELRASHSPFLSVPHELAELLATCAMPAT